MILLIKCLQEGYKFCLGMLQIAYNIALLKTLSLLRNKISSEGTFPGGPAEIILLYKCL
jgi:hypothetical protein